MEDLLNECRSIRRDVFLAASVAGTAHLASAFSCVEMLYALYCGGVLRYRADDPAWPGRDRFVLSKGHGSLALYAVLQHAGLIDRETLMTFCRPGSLLGGEPNMRELPWVEASTGSLGHGLALACGMALALSHTCDGGADPARVYVLVGDGECEEGSIWEAAMTAHKYGLDNLTVLLDHNGIQKMDTVQNIGGVTDWAARFAAFGWDCTACDGHDVAALCRALSGGGGGKPRLIDAHTVKGRGLSLMENDPAWHWRMPNRKETKVFLSELGITQEELDACKKRI